MPVVLINLRINLPNKIYDRCLGLRIMKGATESSTKINITIYKTNRQRKRNL